MKILFICTHNRCRSILAEAIARHVAAGILESASAGSQAANAVHPLTLKLLQQRGISTAGLASKSWHAVKNFQPHIVITVCDSAAGEACPLWLGNAVKAHWGLPDPSRQEGTEKEIEAAFFRVMDTLERRIRQLAAHDLQSLAPTELKHLLEELAELD